MGNRRDRGRSKKRRAAELDDPRLRFAFLLCRTLGLWRHPNQMLAEMPESEFWDWMQMYEREPWGEERADMRMARQVWATFQVASKKKLKEVDFMFKFRKPTPPTPEEYRRKSMRLYAMNGGNAR